MQIEVQGFHALDKNCYSNYCTFSNSFFLLIKHK